jgi:hypothetical protein
METRYEKALRYVRNYNVLHAKHKYCGIIHDQTIEFDTMDVLYISIDTVYVPLQKSKSEQSSNLEYITTTFSSNKEKKNVGHLNIKAEHGDDVYNITAATIVDAMKELIAVILTNKLYKYRFIVFFDGEQKLKEIVEKYLNCWDLKFILDFPHLSHKCYELLSLCIISQRVVDPWGNHEMYQSKGREGEVKKYVMTSLSRLYGRELAHILWAGNIDEAIEYVSHIDPDHVKKGVGLNPLLTYLNNKKKLDCIECYALRKFLGLKNSSNAVESENEAVVANRQKDGEHWSIEGSANNASMNAVFLNHEEDNWFYRNTLTFQMFNPKDYE